MNYVIISGATGGIGKAFAENQIKQGENLILIGRSQSKLDELILYLKSINSSSSLKSYLCNLSDEDDRSLFFQQLNADVVSQNFKIKRLINVAGVDTQMPLSSYTQDKLIFQLRVNFESVVCLTKAVLDINNYDLEILTISSLCGVTPMPYFAAYSATKCALINFFDSIRYEYKKTKVKITTIMPGSCPTRKDIIEDIKKQGLTGKLSSKPPQYIVKKSLIALDKNKRHFVPGVYNKFVYFFSKITPYQIKSKIIGKKFSTKQKDAF